MYSIQEPIFLGVAFEFSAAQCERDGKMTMLLLTAARIISIRPCTSLIRERGGVQTSSVKTSINYTLSLTIRAVFNLEGGTQTSKLRMMSQEVIFDDLSASLLRGGCQVSPGAGRGRAGRGVAAGAAGLKGLSLGVPTVLMPIWFYTV